MPVCVCVCVRVCMYVCLLGKVLTCIHLGVKNRTLLLKDGIPTTTILLLCCSYCFFLFFVYLFICVCSRFCWFVFYCLLVCFVCDYVDVVVVIVLVFSNVA